MTAYLAVQQAYQNFLLLKRRYPDWAYALKIIKVNSAYYKNGEDLRYTPTTLAQEQALFAEAKKGDAEARDFIIRNHLLFCANRARAITRGKIPDDEVISAVNEALIDAVDKFDPSHGKRFTQYLPPFIRGAVSKLWKNLPKAPPFTPALDGPTFELPEEVSVSPADELEAQETKEILGSALAELRDQLSPKQKDLLTAVYDKGLSLSDFAKSRGVSRSNICALHKRILRKLRVKMKRVEL